MSQPPRLLMVRDVEAAPGELLDDPLAFLFAEHWRHRQFCRALEEVAGMPAAPPALLRRLAAYLGADMAVHVQDEEEDLFPLLRLRAEPEDGLERVLGILGADHDAGRSLAQHLRRGLADAAREGQGPAAAPGLSDSIGRFVAHKRRHIALENAVVLPIARLRLTAGDTAAMSRAMKARRGQALGATDAGRFPSSIGP